MAAVTKVHLPHGIAAAPEPIVADILRGHLAKCREVECAGPLAGGEAAQQVLDHAREGEDCLVSLVGHETRIAGRRGPPYAPSVSTSVGNPPGFRGQFAQLPRAIRSPAFTGGTRRRNRVPPAANGKGEGSAFDRPACRPGRIPGARRNRVPPQGQGARRCQAPRPSASLPAESRRARTSSPVSQHTSHSPTSASLSGSAMSPNIPANRSAVPAPNRDTA